MSESRKAGEGRGEGNARRMALILVRAQNTCGTGQNACSFTALLWVRCLPGEVAMGKKEINRTNNVKHCSAIVGGGTRSTLVFSRQEDYSPLLLAQAPPPQTAPWQPSN